MVLFVVAELSFTVWSTFVMFFCTFAEFVVVTEKCKCCELEKLEALDNQKAELGNTKIVALSNLTNLQGS